MLHKEAKQVNKLCMLLFKFPYQHIERKQPTPCVGDITNQPSKSIQLERKKEDIGYHWKHRDTTETGHETAVVSDIIITPLASLTSYKMWVQGGRYNKELLTAPWGYPFQCAAVNLSETLPPLGYTNKTRAGWSQSRGDKEVD